MIAIYFLLAIFVYEASAEKLEKEPQERKSCLLHGGEDVAAPKSPLKRFAERGIVPCDLAVGEIPEGVSRLDQSRIDHTYL